MTFKSRKTGWAKNMKEFWKKYKERVICLPLFAVILLAVVSLIALFYGTVMRFFGFEYQSFGSVILFFLLGAVISFPAGLIAQGLPNVLLHEKILIKPFAVVLFLILDTCVTFVSMAIADYFMQGVSATPAALFIVSFLLAVTSVKEIDGKTPAERRREEKENGEQKQSEREK